MKLWAVLASAAMAIAWGLGAQAQSVYKSIGPDGRVQYGDRPSADGKLDKTMTFDNLPASTLPPASISYVEQLRRMRATPTTGAPSAAPPIKGNVLFTTSWCGYCRKARAYLAEAGVAYQEYDIETPEGADAYVRAGGGRGSVPLLIVGKRRVQGFTLTAYDAFFGIQR